MNFLIMLVLLIAYIIWHYKFRKTPKKSGRGKPMDRAFDSFIELRLYNELTRRGYHVVPQYRCGYYRIDLALPRYRVAIECDGHAFHSSPAQKKRDARRSAYLRRNGWRSVLRFSGSQINKDVSACVNRIEKKLGKNNTW